MTNEEILNHAIQTRNEAAEQFLADYEAGLNCSEYINKKRDEFCSTQEEKDLWDLAFIHSREPEVALKLMGEAKNK